MKRVIKLSVVVIAIISLAGLVFAQEKTDAAKKRTQEQMQKARELRSKSAGTRSFRGSGAREPRTRQGASVRPEMARGMMHQQQMRSLQGQLARKKQALKLQKAELEIIKKMAISENATKTAGLIDKMIANKDAEFADETKKAQEKIKGIKEQIEKQAKERSKMGKRDPEAKPKKEIEKKDK